MNTSDWLVWWVRWGESPRPRLVPSPADYAEGTDWAWWDGDHADTPLLANLPIYALLTPFFHAARNVPKAWWRQFHEASA